MKSNAPKYGIVGGLGAHASLLLHHKILERVKSPTSDLSYPNLVLVSQGLPDFGVNASLSAPAIQQLKATVANLKLLGCSKIWVACNSVHSQKAGWWEDDVCEDWTKAFGCLFPKGAWVLGSKHMTESALYLRGKAPTEEVQSLVNQCIAAVIEGRHWTEQEKVKVVWSRLMGAMGGQPTVLGCTELSVCAASFGIQGLEIYDSLDFIANQIIEHFDRSFT